MALWLFAVLHSAIIFTFKQGRIHDHISRKRWAGALMENKSPLSLNPAVLKNALPTDGWTDGQMDGRTN